MNQRMQEAVNDCRTMKLKDVAKKYNVCLATVGAWKKKLTPDIAAEKEVLRLSLEDHQRLIQEQKEEISDLRKTNKDLSDMWKEAVGKKCPYCETLLEEKHALELKLTKAEQSFSLVPSPAQCAQEEEMQDLLVENNGLKIKVEEMGCEIGFLHRIVNYYASKSGLGLQK